MKLGRLGDFTTVREWRARLLSLGVREIALSSEIAIAAMELEDLHGDPWDRIIVATALVADAVLLTAARPLLDWSGRVRRRDARR